MSWFRINKHINKLRHRGRPDRYAYTWKTVALQYLELLNLDVGGQRALIALHKQLYHTDVNTNQRYIELTELTRMSEFDNFA